mmetsp:Transcript_31850/g.83462  ORF Transcript_31850/g.83462 Transcript_31850/m.83462 type:complete len:265 (+) Transcript_31850:53-847(+)
MDSPPPNSKKAKKGDPPKRVTLISELNLLQRVPGSLDTVSHFLSRLTCGIVHHAGPERTCTNTTRHQVRRVEAECSRTEKDVVHAAGCVINELRRVYAFVRCKEATLAHPYFVSCWITQELYESLSTVGWVGNRKERTSAKNGRTEIFVSICWEVEEVCIFANHCSLWEEGWDERSLTVHVALCWAVEHALRAVAEVDRANSASATSNICVVTRECAELFDRANNFWRVEWKLVGNPCVINSRWLCTQHHVFNPVSCRPASCAA